MYCANRVLSPTKQKIVKKRIFGFDIETYDNNKKFCLASIVGEGYEKKFYRTDHLFTELKTNVIFRDSIVFATNLGFDFFGVFFNEPNFKTQMEGGSLLWAETHFYNSEFHPKKRENDNSLQSLKFVDSLNYANMSVERMGKILGIPKLEKPSFLGQFPKNQKEFKILEEYNLRDSYITFKFMEYIIRSFEELGATFKNTLAGTSMSLFRNKYLETKYWRMPKEFLDEEFGAYYGGRTEALKRGYIKNCYYYDFNSLYPSVMAGHDYPDPNTLRLTHQNSDKYIKMCEGLSDVEIYCPYMKIPLLPVRTKSGRVIFPIGTIRGWYTHIELREALKLGYILKRTYKTHYFNEVCRPFDKFVNDLYKLRQTYKNDKNKMELVVKLVLNSLYGKFGQRYTDMENTVHKSMYDYMEIENITKIERTGEYFRVVNDSEPAGYCIPVWACYVTAYGRIKLHREAVKHNPIYMDTDSLILDHEIPASDKLGELKLEMKIKEGIIVRPKFYGLVDSEDKENVKIKGLGKRLTYMEFLGLDVNRRIDYKKFAKFKESLRRDLIPNEIIDVHKEFSLEDEKRKWTSPFDMKKFSLQDSEPRENDLNDVKNKN